MPYFETTAEVEVYVDEFLDSCSTSDKSEMLESLVEEAVKSPALEKALKESLADNFPGRLSAESAALGGSNISYDQEEFMTSLSKLNAAYYQLSNEDIQKINEMAKRF